MSSNNLDIDVEPEIPPKRIKLSVETDSNQKARILSQILQREIETEIKLRKDDLDKIEENIFLTKKSLVRLRQGAVSDYYKQKTQKDYLQNPPHPAVQDTFFGKTPTNYILVDLTDDVYNTSPDDLFDNLKPGKCVVKKDDESHKDDSNSSEAPKTQEIIKLPCYVPPNSVKIETVKPPEPRGYTSKKHLRIVVGNVSKWLEPDESYGATHKWTVYTKTYDSSLDLSLFVSKVDFFLHPSYKPNDVVSVISPPFKLTRRGWGEFPLRARFHFKNPLDSPVDLMHVLKLDHKHTGFETFGAETALSVWIHLPLEIKSCDKLDGFEDYENDSLGKQENNNSPIIKKENSFIEGIEECLEKNKDSIFFEETGSRTNDFIKVDNDSIFLNDDQQTTGECDVKLPQSHIGNYEQIASENISDGSRVCSEYTSFGLDEIHYNNNTEFEDEFLDECNVVESEVVIDNDEINFNQELLVENANPRPLESGSDILSNDKLASQINSTQTSINYNSDLFTSLESIDFHPDPPLSAEDINILSNIIKSDSAFDQLTSFEDPVFPDATGSESTEDLSKENFSSVYSETVENLLKLNNKDKKDLEGNENLQCIQENVLDATLKDPSINDKKVEFQSIISKLDNKPLNACIAPFLNEKGLLKGNLISILANKSKPVNIVYTKSIPKNIVLKKFDGKIASVPSSVKSALSSPTITSHNLNPTTILKDPVKNNEKVLNKSKLPSGNLSTNVIKKGNPSVINGGLLDSSSSDTRSPLKVNKSPAQNIIISQQNLNDTNVRPTTISPNEKINKKIFNNKDVKSAIIMLQKENGQVILRKETKFKKCKAESFCSPNKVPKLNSESATRSLKRGKINQDNIVKTDKSPYNTLNQSSVNSSLTNAKLPVDSSSTSEVGAKKVLVVNPKVVKIPNNALAQKSMLPFVSVFKKSTDLKKNGSSSNETRERVLLERCPTESTEIAVSWLIKRFPLVDPRAQLSEFRSKHPYCAKSIEDFLNWPFPKQRAAECMRTKAIIHILDKLPNIEKWTSLQVWDWARIRGFTPMKINPVNEGPTLSEDIKFFYNQPTDKIIDYIKICKDLKEKEDVDIDSVNINKEEDKLMNEDVKFKLPPDKDETPFEPELIGLKKFINKCQKNIGAITCAENFYSGIHYAAADRMLISVFHSFLEDIIRRSYNSSWIRHCDRPPPEITENDVKRAILSRKEFDFLVPAKVEKREIPPVTILPNFS